MKKKSLSLYIIIFMLICQVFAVVAPVVAINEKKEELIKERCDTIKDGLKNVQREDAKVRVHLGSKYELILNNYIMPLNVKLVEKNLSNADLVENQNNFVDAKTTFSNDYISYQQQLEELVAMDCKEEPEKFYDKLVKVRQKRKTMDQDTMLLRHLISKHIRLVTKLKEKI